MTIQERLRPGRYKLTVEDYLRLDEAGAFDGARTELIEGEIWIMSPAFARHARIQSQLHSALGAALRESASALVSYIGPSTKLTDDTLPEPDIVLADEHEDGPLPAAKVRLIVEIADSTLDRDVRRKTALYARAGIAEYWIADVKARLVHQMWAPDGDAYGDRRPIAFGDRIDAVTIDGLVVDTAGLA